MALQTAYLPSPLGWLRLSCLGDALVGLDYLHEPPAQGQSAKSPCLASAQAWLEAYFAAAPLPDSPPLEPSGSAFQQAVWRHLASIPPGHTLTYGQLAQRLGSGPRAVGGALRANPIPLFIPCHRILAAHGLGGYGGRNAAGLARKAWLAAHERGWGMRIECAVGPAGPDASEYCA